MFCHSSNCHNLHLLDIFKLDVVSDNLFDLLLSCQKTPYPAKFLCNYATENRNSVLPVLASCFKVRYGTGGYKCWLNKNDIMIINGLALGIS